MNKCPKCETLFEGKIFLCPQCNFKPENSGGFLSFNSALTKDDGNFPIEGFAKLYQKESQNFWFKARNRIILWALDHFFPCAQSMMEIGCGTGFVLEGISNHRSYTRLVGTEVFSQGLSFASERLKNKAELFQIDARNIPFKNEFDIIGAFDVLEHIKEDDIVLTQMRKALKNNGGILITVPQHHWMWSSIDEVSMHQRRYTVKELKQKLKSAGFDCIYATSFVSLLLPVMILSRLRKIINLENSVKQLDLPGFLNYAFESVMQIENLIIRSGLRFPFGGSLLMVGKIIA